MLLLVQVVGVDERVDPGLDARAGGGWGEGSPAARLHQWFATNWPNKGGNAGIEPAWPDYAKTGQSPVHH
mgnify:CR=1 FL=1